jgi:hypothetical protein
MIPSIPSLCFLMTEPNLFLLLTALTGAIGRPMCLLLIGLNKENILGYGKAYG